MASRPVHLAPLIAVAILAGAAGTGSAGAARVERHASTLGSWRLDVARDRFSQSVGCRLRARDKSARFRGGAVGFRFDRNHDVGEAAYRLDGGGARRWRDDLPALIRLGTPVDAGGLANPSAGIVWIPYETLRDVNTVSIVSRPGRKPRMFRLRGLVGLLAAAAARGCRQDAGFFA